MVTATIATSDSEEQQEGTGIYVDAPGGSGKTYLFNTLHAYLISNNIATSCAAWTGIAATLLTAGKTLHSLFKLPVPLTETSVCNVAPNSAQANILRRIKVFIIDEASMIPCYALDAIDRCLSDIMSSDTLFGGKILLLAGDFRQILPVVPRSPPTAVLESSLKRSNLWQRFHQMRLTQNMRTHQNEEEFSTCLYINKIVLFVSHFLCHTFCVTLFGAS